MSQYAVGVKAFTAGAALARARRVKLASGTSVVYSAQGENFVGVTIDAAASGAQVGVRLLGGCTQMVTAAGAINAGAEIYGANDGKVSATAVGPKIGYALEAAAADGDIIEVIVDKDVSESWSA